MKKLVAFFAIITLCLSGFAACSAETGGQPDPTATPTVAPTTAPTTAPTEPPAEEENDLAAARAYLYTMYKDQNEVTPTDYTVVSVVNIGGVLINVDWTADSDTISFIPGDNKMVTVDVDDQNPEEVSYTLTATLTDATGATETVTFARRVPAAIIIDAGMSYAEIVDLAYTVEPGITLDGTYRLFGTITKIDTAWSEDYQNITVTIAIAGKEDKPVMCYRLKGDGAKDLKVGDAITVEGSFTNYNGTIEFAAGCVLIGMGDFPDQSALLDAAYALAEDLSMNAPSVMWGVISKIDTAWSEDYQNITVTIVVDGDTERPIMCYRLKGDGAKDLAVGDSIAVVGTIKNYKGTIEFDSGCQLIPVEAFASAKTAVAAYELEEGISLTSEASMTGVISSIDTAWSEDYQNITVTIVVGGLEDYKIMCYRLKGEGAKDLAVGDTITVTGILKNYKGTIEFDSGCVLNSVIKAGAVEPTPTPEPTPAIEMPTTVEGILDAAYALEAGTSLPEECTLTGVITSVDTPYSEQYSNVTVTIVVNGITDKAIQCFRLKGEGADTIAVGDTITVTGKITNYNGKIQFNSGCTLDTVAAGTGESAGEAVALNASELTLGDITENTTFGAFTVNASADKKVTIDENAKSGDNGLAFTQRLKLNGSGKIEHRSVSFTTTGPATVTVYAMSGSKDATRQLVLLGADGTELASKDALGAVENDVIPAITYEITEAGTYYICSADSGINIYYIEIE